MNPHLSLLVTLPLGALGPFQAAIISVSARTPDANGWRGVVYLNAGEYQLATTLNINASGVVLKGAGNHATSGTRLRATDPQQYPLVSLAGSGSRCKVADPALSDVTGSYEWSLDLATWYP